MSSASCPHCECQAGGHYVLVMGTFSGSVLSTAQRNLWKAGGREGGREEEGQGEKDRQHHRTAANPRGPVLWAARP